MIELETDEQPVAKMPPLPHPLEPGERGPLRRRGMTRVLVIATFIVLAVWAVNYGAATGEVSQAFREAGQAAPLARLLDPLLIARACPAGLLTMMAAVVGFFALLRLNAAAHIEQAVLQALGTNASARRETGGRTWPWIVAGLAVVAAAIAILEHSEPCFFVQDDNFANVLPNILHGCRTMFQGEFPEFDPCQYMGMPDVGKGMYTLFYPPTIAAYAVARYVLGNENWTLEVFAALHLLAGYLASFAAARMAGLRPALAFSLAISFVLSGYILLVGRGWHAVVTLVVWLPLLFCSIEAWLNGRTGWRWLLASGAAIGGFYYTGFPQYWVYGLLFMGLVAAIAVACGRVAVKQLIWPAAAGLIGIAIVLPSLVVQLEITRGMADKPVNAGMGFEQGLVATVAPFPLAHADGFMGLPANREKELQTQWYYAGTILVATGFLAVGVLLAYRCNRRWLGQHPWSVAAVAALWLGLGSAGLLWNWLGLLPVIRTVNHHPHRLLPFFVFFALIAGGLLIEGLLRRTTQKWERRWGYWIAAATAVLMLYHVSLSRNSLWCYGDRPYPPLPKEIAQRVLPSENPRAGRVTWCGPVRTRLPGFANLLPLSLPSAYGAWTTGGYDAIVENRPETDAMQRRMYETPLEAARAYGVRWILAANPEHYRPERDYWQAVRQEDWCFGFSEAGGDRMTDAIIPAAQLRVEREELRLYELADASPMAFDLDRPRDGLPIRFHGWGAEVETPGDGDKSIIVNMAMRPWVRATSGNLVLPAVADAWGRVQVQVPAGITRFRVGYQLPWRRGLLLGAGLLLATLFGMAIFVRGQGRSGSAVAV